MSFRIYLLDVTLSVSVILVPFGNGHGNALHPLISNEFKVTPVVPLMI